MASSLGGISLPAGDGLVEAASSPGLKLPCRPKVGGSSRHGEEKTSFPASLAVLAALPRLPGEQAGTCLSVALLQLRQSRVQRPQGLPVVLGLDFQQLPKKGHTASMQEPPGAFLPQEMSTH